MKDLQMIIVILITMGFIFSQQAIGAGVKSGGALIPPDNSINDKNQTVKKTTKPLVKEKKSKYTLQKINSTIVKHGNKIVLKFSKKVDRLTLFDHNSKRIGSFPGGSVFDITEIIKKVKGERLKIQYHTPNPNNTGIKGRNKLSLPDQQDN